MKCQFNQFYQQRLKIILILFLGFIPAFAFAYTEPEETYFVDAYINKINLHDALPVYVYQKQSYIHLSEWLVSVDFPITEKNGIWMGSFSPEATVFKLDMNRNAISRDKSKTADAIKEQPLNANDFIQTPDGLAIHIQTLAKWFGIEISFDPRKQLLKLTSPNYSFPIEIQNQRDLNKKKITNKEEFEGMRFLDDQYHWATSPMIDFNSEAFHYDNANNTYSGVNAGITSTFDMLKHSVYYNLNSSTYDNNTPTITQQRLTVSRNSASENSYMALGLRHYEFGDLYGEKRDLISPSQTAVGIFATRRDAAEMEGDSVNIVGNATPGWDVELYQYGSLIAFSTVDSDGRFIFLNQPLSIGSNEFEVKIFSPQGQVDVRKYEFYSAQDTFKQGDIDYNVGHYDFNKRLFENSIYTPPPDEKSDFAEVFIAATDWLRFGGGVHQQRYSNFINGISIDNTLSFVSTTLALTIANIDAQLAQDANHFTAKKYSLRAFQFAHNIRLTREEFDKNYESLLYINGSPYKNKNAFYLSHAINSWDIFNFYSFTAERNALFNQSTETNYDFSLSGRVWRLGFRNDINYNNINNNSITEGRFIVSGRFFRINSRTEYLYEIKPETLSQAALQSFYWDIKENFYNEITYTKNYTADTDTFANILSWRNQKHIISLTTSTTCIPQSENSWYVGLSYSTSLFYNENTQSLAQTSQNQAQTGRTSLQFFKDANQNGIKDADETVISEFSKTVNDEEMLSNNSQITLYNLPTQSNYPVKSDNYNIHDYDVALKDTGYVIFTHEGSNNQYDLPATPIGHIEGYIMTEDKNSIIGIKNARIGLWQDNKRVIATHSFRDGYFSFSNIPAGLYTLRIRKTGYAYTSITIEIKANGEYEMLDNIMLIKTVNED